jgi:hypothetical protein
MKSALFPFRVLLVLVFMLVLPMNAAADQGILSPQATDRYVSLTGTDSGGCTNPSNPCRTIDYAFDQTDSGDTIHIAAGEYIENISLFHGVNLVGAGATTTILNGNAFSNVVYVFSDTIPTTISHLTIRNGASEYGGGVGNISQLTLDDVIIEDNAVTSQGGGIYNDGDLTMLNSIVRNNSSSNVAAGMINHNTAVIENSTFTGNEVTSSNYGGAIHNNADATMELTNVTISSNQAYSSGGLSNSGTADLVNVTIANNTGDGIGYFSAGSVVNSILSGNTDENCGVLMTAFSLGSNLDSDASCGFTGSGDLQDTPAMLQPLRYVNSTIPTHSPLADSPVVDSGDPAHCPGSDARGVTRPLDGDGTGGAVCDRGAHEYDPATDKPRTFIPLVGNKF